MADVDQAYPQLSALSRERGRSLSELAVAAPNPSMKYLGLAESCWCVENEVPRWPAADAYGYLATLEAMLDRVTMDAAARESLWKKLIPTGSSFLDTVAEAAWAVHFTDKPLPVRCEVPFDAGDRNSKDADLVVNLSREDCWLDVKSIHPNADAFDMTGNEDASPYALLSPDQVVGILSDRAKTKYDDKFRAAVATGPLQKSFVGLLLCVLKWEQSIPLLLVARPTAPLGLFEKCPNLLVVWIHTLAKADGADLLRPVPLLRWNRP